MRVFASLIHAMRRLSTRSDEPDRHPPIASPSSAIDEEERERIRAQVALGMRRSFLRRVRRGNGA
jgi:hypothetical protein